MSVLVGFSKVNLMDVLPEDKPCNMPILGIGFYLEQKDKKSFFFTVDFMDFDLETVTTLTNAIKEELPNTQIHIVTTHNHGAASCNTLKMSQFCLHAKNCAKIAVTNAQAAQVRIAIGNMEENLSFNRRIFVPTLDSSFTCFYGIDKVKENNANNFVNRAIEQLENNLLCFTGDTTKVYEIKESSSLTFNNGNPQIAVIEFKSLSNKPIGNIVNFACHAVCCNMPNTYSSDYPGYLRSNMEKSLGGISLFFNGPCAEIAPAIPSKSIAFAQKMADALSSKALELIKESSFSLLEDFSDKIWEIPLPVRSEILTNNIEIPQISQEITQLLDKKAILEQERVKAIMPFLMGIYNNGNKSKSNDITISTALLKLNNYNLLFFSGETFNSTAQEIISNYPNKNFITITEHGRTAMYIPPKEEYRCGGYEPTCATVSNLAEAKLKEKLINLLKEK